MNDFTIFAQGPTCRKRRRRLGVAAALGLLLVAATRLRKRAARTNP